MDRDQQLDTVRKVNRYIASLQVYGIATTVPHGVGRPIDNALALARLIVRGIFEKFPALKLVGTHLGGDICE